STLSASTRAAWIESRTPADWSLGVEGTFAVTSASPSSATRSVKVPPTSTPTRFTRVSRALYVRFAVGRQPAARDPPIHHPRALRTRARRAGGGRPPRSRSPLARPRELRQRLRVQSPCAGRPDRVRGPAGTLARPQLRRQHDHGRVVDARVAAGGR